MTDLRSILANLDKAFNNRIRLAIMTALSQNEWTDFNALKIALDLTDGNLASHIAALEECDYVKVKKRFIGKKPNTSYSLSERGKRAYFVHLNALKELMSRTKM
jgi:DNA-binding HxlR family transcriptional regulator